MDNLNWAAYSYGGWSEPVLLEGGERQHALIPGGLQGQDYADGLSWHQNAEMWEKAIKCKFDDIDASEDVNNSCTLVEIDLVTNITSLSISDLCPGGNRGGAAAYI